jgi:hypothetical protein
MEPARPHGGGGGHAFPSGESSAANPLIEGLDMPETPSPSTWENTVMLNAVLESEESGEAESTGSNALREAVEARSRSSVLRPPKRLGGKGAIKAPINDVNKRIRSLVNDVEKINQEEQSQQGRLEALCAQLTEAFSALKVEQQEKEKMYLQRFTALEQKIEAQEKDIEELRMGRKAVREPMPAARSPPPEQAASQTPRTTPRILEQTPAAVGAKEQDPTTPAASSSRPQRQTQRLYAAAARTVTAKNCQEWQIVASKPKRAPSKPSTALKPGTTTPVSHSKPRDLKPVREKDKEARRLLFRREGGLKAPEAEREEVILALNRALAKKDFPAFVRVVDAGYTRTGAMSVLLERGALGTMLVPQYRDVLVAAARQADRAVVSVELPEQWYKVKVHGVPTRRYFHLGLALAREEIELGTGIKLMRDPTWLRNPQDIEGNGSTIVITIGSHDELKRVLINGIRFGGTRYKTELFWELGADTVCPRCCGIGHKNFRACGDRPPCCYVCADAHEGSEHTCKVVSCTAKPGTACQHAPAKCANCGGPHPATAGTCPKIREARRRLMITTHQQSTAQAQELRQTPEPAESEVGLGAAVAPKAPPGGAQDEPEDVDMGASSQFLEQAASTPSTC